MIKNWLNFIKECLEKQKPLFKTDRKYLDNKISSFISQTQIDSPEELVNLSSVKKIIDLGIGDQGRINHIYSTLKNKKNADSDCIPFFFVI